MASRHQSVSIFTLISVFDWMSVILLLSVSQDIYTNAACPSDYSPAVRMCDDSTTTNWRIFLDASSAEHVSVTQCKCTLLFHGDGVVTWIQHKVPGYDGCGTSIDLMSTGSSTIRFGCKGGSFSSPTLHSGSTINITLNKPTTLSEIMSVNYCYHIATDSPNSITVRCCAPGNTVTCLNTNVDDTTVSTTTTTTTTTRKPTKAIPNPTTEKPVVTTGNKPIDNTIATPTDKSATTTGIPDKTSTSTLGHTSLGQVKQTKDEEPFPVEIVAPVAGIVVLACLVIVVVVICRKRSKSRGKQKRAVDDTEYDNDANATSTGDVSRGRETLPVRHYSANDTGDVYAVVNKASTSQTDLTNPATEYANVQQPTSKVSKNYTKLSGITDDDVTYSVVNKRNSNKEAVNQVQDTSAANAGTGGIVYSQLQFREKKLDSEFIQKSDNLDNSEKTIYAEVQS
ncbi:hypothetical protein ScPMuIL_012210 [Solemya velum]